MSRASISRSPGSPGPPPRLATTRPRRSFGAERVDGRRRFGRLKPPGESEGQSLGRGIRDRETAHRPGIGPRPALSCSGATTATGSTRAACPMGSGHRLLEPPRGRVAILRFQPSGDYLGAEVRDSSLPEPPGWGTSVRPGGRGPPPGRDRAGAGPRAGPAVRRRPLEGGNPAGSTTSTRSLAADPRPSARATPIMSPTNWECLASVGPRA